MCNQMRCRLIMICILFLAAGVALAGPENYSGKWVLDKGKSDFSMGRPGGEMPDITMKVEAAKDAIKVSQTFTSSQGERSMEQSFIPDGLEHEVAGMMGSKGKATAKWDGDKLDIKVIYKVERDGQEMTWTEISKWELSADGATLTIHSTFESEMGNRTGKRVFQKK